MTPRAQAPARLALASLLLAGPLPSRAMDFSSSAIGTGGAEFLNLDVGPRGIAMGGAISAVTSDVFSLYWNPAGLNNIPRASAGAMHNEYLAGIRMQYAGYAQRITDLAVLGAAVRYLDAGEIDNTDVNGTVMGRFRPRNYVYEIGWAEQITDLADAERDVAIGVTARWIQSDLVAHANGIAGDVGMQASYPEAARPYFFSLVAQNLGRGQKFDKVRDRLPFRGRVGAAIYPAPFALLSLEAVLPVSNTPYGAVGAELSMDAPSDVKGFLRAGYNTLDQFGGLDGLRGVSFGIGMKIIDLSIDYAFVPYGILGQTHRVSVGWNLPAKHSRRFTER
jgi:hypothetical protein